MWVVEQRLTVPSRTPSKMRLGNKHGGRNAEKMKKKKGGPEGERKKLPLTAQIQVSERAPTGGLQEFRQGGEQVSILEDPTQGKVYSGDASRKRQS